MPDLLPTCVGVMRHVSAHDTADPKSVPEDRLKLPWGQKKPVVSSEGRTIALQAGYALAETLDHALFAKQESSSSPNGVRRLSIRLLHPDTDVARRTTALLQDGLNQYSSPWEKLDLTISVDTCTELLISSAADRDTIDARVEAIITCLGRAKKDRTAEMDATLEAAVAIMHDPAASWLLQRLVKPPTSDRWTALKAVSSDKHMQFWLHSPNQLPLRNGELVMTQRQVETRKPVWAISPSSEKLIDDIREKISKKMDSAKQLGAFATALFGFAVTGVLRERPQGLLEIGAWLGVATLAIAVAVFFSTLFRYDSLLMPRQLWASTPPQHTARLGVFARPPSSASWVLFQNMMMIWLRGFTVACALVALGGALVVIAISHPTGWRGWGLVFILVAPTALLGWNVWKVSRPELGVND